MSLPNAPLNLLDLLGTELPIIQAPMAGVSTPAMAAAVSNAGALGSIAIGASNASGARRMIREARELSRRPLNVNVFCHEPAKRDPAVEAAWISRFRPEFDALGARAPNDLTQIYRSFVEDDEMLAVILEERPDIVSFHFGFPPPDRMRALRQAGIVLIGSATNLAEAEMLVTAGVHVVVAQGYEAGGHRGIFNPNARDDKLSTIALTRILVRKLAIPVVAAGGIMDGRGVSAALRLGAGAAQLGTAFIACPESLADPMYRAALASEASYHTVMTRVVSGRLARSLPNLFTELGATISDDAIPDYPVAYDLGKALINASKSAHPGRFSANWAGQGAPLARSMPAARLVATLAAELTVL